MTTAVVVPAPEVEGRPSYVTVARSVGSWLLTTDHKRIGLLYLASVTVFLFLGGLFAMLIRVEHLTPGPTIMDASTGYQGVFGSLVSIGRAPGRDPSGQ